MLVILLYTIFLDTFDWNLGMSDTSICANLDDHFSQYAFLIWKNLNKVLTYPML